jgi:hypothetical protein
MGTTHFTAVLPAVALWVVLSVLGSALTGLNVLLWPLTALFHFYCFKELSKQGA